MKFIEFKTNDALDEAAADFILRQILAKEHSLISAATGNSPTGAYKRLLDRKAGIPLEKISFVKLDEWYGLDMKDPGSCESYLQQHLIGPLGIPPERFTSFDSMAKDPVAECTRLVDFLQEKGPIDICILGLGENGHIAFNEPGPYLQPHAHLGQLSKTSLSHKMISDVKKSLEHGLTLGMADILQSKTILLIVNGKHKINVLEQLMKGQISTDLPGSLLWLHPAAFCYYCKI
jgi:galactosamine-6-phosphate isomerase